MAKEDTHTNKSGMGEHEERNIKVYNGVVEVGQSEESDECS